MDNFTQGGDIILSLASDSEVPIFLFKEEETEVRADDTLVMTSETKLMSTSVTDAEVADFKNETDDFDPCLYDVEFPLEHQASFANSIFELGLLKSSPKILLSLMPNFESLTTEHIKSHLQKYRIHHERSRSEFLAYYNRHILNGFTKFQANREWNHSNDSKDNLTAEPETTAKYSYEPSSFASDARGCRSSVQSVEFTASTIDSNESNTSDLANIQFAKEYIEDWKNIVDGLLLETSKADSFIQQSSRINFSSNLQV